MAGILDGYQFDPQAYGGGGGMGLLGLLAQQYGLPQPGQPAVGFPAPVTDYTGTAGALDPKWRALLAGNTDAYQQPQAQGQQAPPLGPPIDVPSLQVAGAGGYPSDAQLPPTSTPTAGTGLLGGNLFSGGVSPAGPAPGAGQQPGIPAQPAAAGPGVGDRLGSAWQGLGQGGLTSMVGGLITGQRQDPQGLLERALMERGVSPLEARAAVKNPQLLPTVLAEQGQGATSQAFEQALLAKGASPQQARALAQAAKYDPDVRKALSTTLYQAPSLVSGGTNPLTGEITHQVYNPNNQTLSNLAPAAQGGGAAQTLTPANAAAVGLPPMSNNQLGQIQALNQEGLTGDEYAAKLKAISPAYAAKVTSMSKGDLPYPSGPIMKTPYGQLLTDSISSVKPGVTAQDYGSKQKTRNYWTSGAGASEVKAINTAIYHTAKLQQFSDIMGGVNVLPEYINPMVQGFKKNIGNAEFQDAKKGWDVFSEIVAGEVSKALNAGVVHVDDKKKWNSILSGADGPVQRTAAIKSVMEALEGRTQSQAVNYEQGMGSARDPISFIDPRNRETFSLLKAGEKAYGLKNGPVLPTDETVKAIGSPQQGTASQQTQQTMTPVDKQALDWANANPKDPRAAKIKQRLGVQ